MKRVSRAGYFLRHGWEIPLAAVSFGFFKASRLLVGALLKRYAAAANRGGHRWRVLSKEALAPAIGLPMMMTRGPRWNTHALIATLGPFEVIERVEIEDRIAEASTSSWTIVIYRFPQVRTVGSIGTLDGTKAAGWKEVPLPKGQYNLGLRYYGGRFPLQLPGVKADGKEIVRATEVQDDPNVFYRELRRRKNWFYVAAQYYVLPMLLCREWLPEAWVRSEFLPVGDPDTEFEFGAILKGERLVMNCGKALESYDVYLTVYDRASFPVIWEQVKEAEYRTEAVKESGFWLVRFRLKGRGGSRGREGFKVWVE